jgi:hypothetical protein
MDLTDLKVRVDTARKEMEAPLAPDEESRPILPVTEYLKEEDTTVLWEAVRALREHHVSIFNQYPENTLATNIVYVLGDLADTPSLAELADRLGEAAKEEGPWLVSTPLANISLPSAMLPIDDGAVLQRAYLGREVGDEEYNEVVDAHAEVFRAIGDYLSPPGRWMAPGRRGEDAVDTTRSAALLTVEDGTRALAMSRARAKAMYALAIWTVTSPPGDFAQLPDLGIYGPQPFLHMPQRSKEHDPGEWISKKRASVGSIHHRSEYEVPTGDLLTLPFEALRAVRASRSAQALLSASWATFEAARGSRFLLSERLRHILVAVETLGEPEPGEPMKWERWENLSKRYGVHDELRGRGYSEEGIARAETRLKNARNIATHGADAALIDLGFPEGAERALRFGDPVPGEDLGFAALSADLTILIFGVQHVLAGLLRHQRDASWDDKEFEHQFAVA